MTRRIANTLSYVLPRLAKTGDKIPAIAEEFHCSVLKQNGGSLAARNQLSFAFLSIFLVVKGLFIRKSDTDWQHHSWSDFLPSKFEYWENLRNFRKSSRKVAGLSAAGPSAGKVTWFFQSGHSHHEVI